ncbi:hypothetical protein [Methylobacterium sp. 1030]|uniref:hypothetical protein n=1 Tax=Methylobacterium sp. 1030 TaxID=3156404 RepID=UPI00339B2840
MTRIVVTGLWICVITVLSSYAAVSWMPNIRASGSEDYLEGLAYQKLPPLQIPVIAEGAVQGYVLATIVFTADSLSMKSMPVAPDSFVRDETFQQIYNDKGLNFKNLKKYDITGRLDQIRQAVNRRIGAEIVRDVMIENFNFISKNDLKS